MKNNKLKNHQWLSYEDLAWTEFIISSPDQNDEEVEYLCKAIFENSTFKPKTLLHLGCGAGAYDYAFKKYFSITGVDISNGMLEMARQLNNDVKYVCGDMRTINLESQFDIVAIPDSIGYMTTKEDLGKTIRTAYNHLNNDGILMLVAHMQEDFKENNFIYSGSKDDIHITIFENNFITSKTTYESTIVYLIRRNKKLETYMDIHTIGLFDSITWHKILKENRFEIKIIKALNTYDRFMLEDGDYPQVMFICKKID